jgi:hypothetical protein
MRQFPERKIFDNRELFPPGLMQCCTILTAFMGKRELNENVLGCPWTLAANVQIKFLLKVLNNVDLLVMTQISRCGFESTN